MPWKESCSMDERVHFISRLRDGEGMSELCREFGISRKTGYKFQNRYLNEGPTGLMSRSSRPQNLANSTDLKIRRLILKAKESRPTWGAAKLRVLLTRDNPGIYLPSKNTIHAVLDAEGLVKKRRRKYIRHMQGTERVESNLPNQLWCADYKGQFRLQNRQYCYPLTISDHKTRFLLSCDSHDSTDLQGAQQTFHETFSEYGLPDAIRTDNGSPFASSQALCSLTRLSVWWMTLGIRIERSDPGCPQHNGRHERIHRTMKEDPVVKNPAKDFLTQQDRFDLFRDDYNTKRPHEALDMETPSDHYTLSNRKMPINIPDQKYPDCDHTRRVTKCGSIFTSDYRFFLSAALGHQYVGMSEEDDDIWTVKFMDLELGYFDKFEEVFHRADQ